MTTPNEILAAAKIYRCEGNRTVLGVLLKLAAENGGTFSLSGRRLAVLLWGTAKKSGDAWRYLNRFEKSGLLQRVALAQGRTATTWHFQEAANV